MPAINDILNDLQRTQQTATTKTASAQPASPVAQAAADLNASLSQLDLTKTAQSAQAPATGGSAVAAVQKMAQELADADEHQRIKSAQLYGAAIFDGFVSRANQYAAHAPATKTAQAQPSDERAVKIAAHLGYAEADVAVGRLIQAEKTAAAQQQGTVIDGIEFAMQKIAHAADDCFLRGYRQMEDLATALQSNE